MASVLRGSISLWAPLKQLLKPRVVAPVVREEICFATDPVLEILKRYPANVWQFTFSECRVDSRWPLRVNGTCMNPKGATVAIEIGAPPPEAVHESGFIKVTVDAVCVYRQVWDAYSLAPGRSVRDEVLRSPYWRWIESRYNANLHFLEQRRRDEMAEEAARTSVLYEEAISKL